jgi:small-conductance mechanosensitive channel
MTLSIQSLSRKNRFINHPFVFVLLCALTFLLFHPLSVQGQEKKTSDEPTTIAPILQAHKNVLKGYESSLNEITQQLPELTEKIQKQLETLKPYFNSLFRLKSVAKNNYKKTIILKQNVSGLHKEVNDLTLPLKKIEKELQDLHETLLQHKEETQERKNFTSMFDSETVDKEDLENDLERIEHLIGQEQQLQAKIEQILNPVNQFKNQITSLEKDVEQELSKAWQEYFLSPSPPIFTVPIKNQIEQMQIWWQDLAIYSQFFLLGAIPWDQLAVKWVGFSVLSFSLLCILLFWIRSKIPDLSLHQTLVANLVLCLGLGLSLGYHFIEFQYQSILLPVLWHIFLSLGFITCLWAVRISLLAHDEQLKNPLWILWTLFALSLLIQNLTFPSFMLQIIWIIILILFCLWLKTKRPFYTETFEKVTCLCSMVLFSLFALIAFGGWINLSLLLTDLWFVMCLTAQFGSIATKLLKQKVSSFPDTHLGYLGRGIVQGTAIPLLWILCLLLIGLWLNLSFGDFSFLRKLSTLRLGWGKISINLARLILIIIGFYLARSGLILIKSLLNSLSKPQGQIEPGTVASLKTLLVYVIWAIFIIAALALLGLNLTSLTVVAGGLSVGIGFGLQSIINNFISGLILLFGRSIQPGDILQIGDLWAEVKEVNIRATEIETFDRSSLLVPNSKLIGEQITNWTHRDRTLRRKIDVGVAYGSDIQLVDKLLKEVAKTHQHILRFPHPFVRFSNFGDSSLEFTLYFYSTIDYGWMAESDLRFEIDRVFREHGIVIAFPQRDIHVKTASALEPF